MNPPDNIDNEGSDIIFFQRSVPGHDDKIQFESSLYKGYFLAYRRLYFQTHFELMNNETNLQCSSFQKPKLKLKIA